MLRVAAPCLLLCALILADANVDLMAHEASAFSRFSGQPALQHGSLAEHAHARAHERSLEHWGADLVVVVTWHSRGLEGLRGVPLDLGVLSFVLLVKGEARSCERDVPDWLAPHVAQCSQLPNDEGRYSHSVAWFLHEHYHRLPRLILFAQDDDAPRHELELLPRTAAAFADWLARAEEDPFASSAACLCNVVVERWESAEQYGESYDTMQLLLRMGAAGHELGHNVTRLRWPASLQFVLSGRAARRAPRLLYGLMLELLTSTTGRSKGSTPALYVCNEADALDGKRCRSPTDHAHMFERMVWLLLDPHYARRDMTLRYTD